MISPPTPLVGREDERKRILACLEAKLNVLIEGPVGVGKTFLTLSIIRNLGLPIFRVDGDSRYSEQKLCGWFDPPSVIQKGYHPDAFIPGPLVEAMRKGGVLFINELNRLPEGVQNVLLPAIDERLVIVPRLGPIHALDGFRVIATQNPKEFVATSHLSEAILDRFELIQIDYQTEEEEIQIVTSELQKQSWKSDQAPHLPTAATRLARLTRNHPRVRRGASIRAANSIAEITWSLLLQAHAHQGEGKSSNHEFADAFLAAARMGLPTRIEIEREVDPQISTRSERDFLIQEWVQQILNQLNISFPKLKKKS